MTTTHKPSLAAQLEALRIEREALLTEVARLSADNQELREWHSASLAVINELKAGLEEAEVRVAAACDHAEREIKDARQAQRDTEQREASFGLLIDYYAGLGSSMWANTEHGEYLELARKAFNARIKLPAHGRSTRVVFEFNPNVKGDYDRASKLARESNGIVRRAV